MTKKTELWLHNLFAAIIGGGSGAVVSAFASMGIDPEKFNISSGQGFSHLIEMMGANFVISGLLSMFFYLKQSPLPPESTGDTVTFTKPQDPTTPPTP